MKKLKKMEKSVGNKEGLENVEIDKQFVIFHHILEMTEPEKIVLMGSILERLIAIEKKEGKQHKL